MRDQYSARNRLQPLDLGRSAFHNAGRCEGTDSVRILSFQSGLHDASAAAFEDYRLVAAVQEERLRREKGWGDDVPWLAIDEVLRIAGWSMASQGTSSP